jgi:FMN phosphatase YigB (HAD superfamily)
LDYEVRAVEIQPRKLVIFDIDDTLVHTQTTVHVIKDGRAVKALNSHDFTHYKLQPGESFDFENFRNAQEFFNNSKPIIPMIDQLKHDINTGNKVVMVTARADFDDRELFLDTFRKYGVDMDRVHVYRAGNMNNKIQTEEKKKIIIRGLMDKTPYTKAIMYDDAVPNLKSFLELKQEYPQTRFYAWHVSLEGDASEYHRTNESQSLEERKKKRKPRHAAYGPGLYGGYGYYANYGNSDSSGDSGGDGGGGESMKNENFADGRSPGRNSQLNTLHDPQRMASAVAYLTDYYDSKEEAYQIIDAYTASVDKLITQGGAVYRAVWVAPGQKPKLKQPGLHWTLTPQSAEEYLQSEAGEYAAMDMDLDDQPHAYILSATVGPNNITNHGVNFAQQHHEQEVRIVDPKQAQIKVVKQVGMTENFADGRNPQDKGDAKRHGVPTKASVSTLRKVAKQGGRKGQLSHWMANMKAGRNK